MTTIIIIAVYLIGAILFYFTEVRKQGLDRFSKIWFTMFWPPIIVLSVTMWISDKISKLF